MVLRSPTLTTLEINVHDSVECARKRNFSVQVEESPNYNECRRVSIVVEALLQRDPGAPEPPVKTVERLVSGRPDMGTEPEQEERERAITLAKAVETATAYRLSAGVEARLREILDRLWNVFRCGLRVTRLPVSSR